MGKLKRHSYPISLRVDLQKYVSDCRKCSLTLQKMPSKNKSIFVGKIKFEDMHLENTAEIPKSFTRFWRQQRLKANFQKSPIRYEIH